METQHIIKVITYSFYFFFFTKLIVQLILNFKNHNHINLNKNNVPQLFRRKVSIDDHRKAAKYNMDKLTFGRKSLIIHALITLIWLPGGLLNKVDLWLRGFDLPMIYTGTLLFIIYALISLIASLPESIYETFVLEEKYGFNKTNKSTFFLDFCKHLTIGAILGIPLLLGILWIIEQLGTWWWFYAWVFLTVTQLFLMWLYPVVIAPLFNKFTKLEEGDVKNTLEKLLERTNFSYKGIYVMDASKRSAHGNAYFTGVGNNKRIVFFDTLLEKLTPQQIEAVLAHELGHFKLKHVLKMLFIALLSSFIGFAILRLLADWEPFFHALYVQNPSSYMAIMLFTIVAPYYTFFLTPISAHFSRKHEYQADDFAAKYSDPKQLAEALVNMYKENASTLTPDPLFSRFYYSHPPAAERVTALSNYKRSSVKN
ncbi:MAG: M48 family metallopeptidase [bacterium]